MQIKLPKTIKDCRPKELAKWIYLTKDGVDLEGLIQKLEFKVNVLSIFSGMSKDEIGQFDFKDVHKAFDYILGVLHYESGEPKGEVTIEGNKYVFNKDFGSYNTAQIVDIKNTDVFNNPLEVLSILYVEEGMVYNQLDENKNIVNYKEERMRLFKDFPGDEFLDVFTFFLDYYEKRKTAITTLGIVKAEMMMEQTVKDMKTK